MGILTFITGDLQQFYKFNNDWKVGYTRLAILKAASSHRFLPVLIFRIAQHLETKRFKTLARVLCLINYWMHGIEISLSCKIKPGLYLPHPNGVVIGAESIGRAVVIGQQVTIGAAYVQENSKNNSERPIIGDGVMIGPGAKLLGHFSVPDNSKIPANAVVTAKSISLIIKNHGE